MASTYSALKIELIATGEQSGTWGTTTNNNLGNDALGEAITGSADVAFSSADVTVTLTDTNASQTARNLRLNLTGTSGGARQLILGSGCQIEKLYLINNGLADAVTVKNTSGTGITVPAGKSTFVFNNGTNVVEAANYFPGTASSGANSDITSLSGLTTPLSIAQGGTGTSSTTFTNLTTNVTGTLPIANGGTGSTSTTFVNAATNITGTLPIANGGTGSTSTTFVNAATNVTGTLPVANGGTGASTLTANSVIIGAGTSAVTFVAPGSSGNVLQSNGSTWTSAAASATGTLIGYNVYTSSSSYSKGTNSPTFVIVEVIGGGGNGGASGGNQFVGSVAAGSGGGGGGYARELILASALSASETVTVGGAGGTSSFGSFVSATGGATGANGPGGGQPGSGGSGSGGDINMTGSVGTYNPSTSVGGFGGASAFAYGGQVIGAIGGGSAVAGNTGLAYGGGGSGAARSSNNTNAGGGAGASGLVIVWEYK